VRELRKGRRVEVALMEPAGDRCAMGSHDWRQVAGTGRHDYEECRRCPARRIVDLEPRAEAQEAVDLDWVCRRNAAGGPEVASGSARRSLLSIPIQRIHAR
jgi:hypothetical protein